MGADGALLSAVTMHARARAALPPAAPDPESLSSPGVAEGSVQGTPAVVIAVYNPCLQFMSRSCLESKLRQWESL